MMERILQAFGALVCGMTRKHKWTRARDNNLRRDKRCKRCNLVVEVKTRKPAAKPV